MPIDISSYHTDTNIHNNLGVSPKQNLPDPGSFSTFADYKNALGKVTNTPIELMGTLTDPKIQKYIGKLCESFPNINKEQIIALIQRESGGNPRARSSSGSRGIMQLTSSVFTDMHRIGGLGRGISEYLDNFKKIQPELLERLRVKYPEFVGIIEKIQQLSPKDQSNFTIYTRQLQSIIMQSTNRGEVELNMLMGSLYLDSINDRSNRRIDNVSMRESSGFMKIIKQLRGVNLKSINKMLTEKQFKSISQSELVETIANIANNKKKFGNFLTHYNYNGQKNIDPDGSEHRIKYALVLAISIDQLKSKNTFS